MMRLGFRSLSKIWHKNPVLVAGCARGFQSNDRPKNSVKGVLEAAHKVDEKVAPLDWPFFVDMRHGKKDTHTFSDNEMNRRLTNLRNIMTSKGLDACVFMSFQNVKYFSDFLYCTFGRPYALVVTMDDSITVSADSGSIIHFVGLSGAAHYLVCIDGGQPWRRSFGNNVTYTDWQQDNFFRALKCLVESDTAKQVGFELDAISMTHMKKIHDFLPSIKKVDISRDASKIRLIKSCEEIKLIRDGAAIADLGGHAAIEALEEGKEEWEVAQQVVQTLVKNVAKKYPHTEIMDSWSWIQSGINTDGAHNPLTSRKIQSGDILSINAFPSISGYYTALERTVFLNHCSEAHLAFWEANVAVHRRGMELIKPGARCCDIANELDEMYKSNDLLRYRSAGFGHSFGVLSHYYGRESEVEIRNDVETVIEPGMVVSLLPMIMIPDGKPGAGAYREHDILIIKEDGNENITKFPFGPEHNIIVK